MPFAERVRESGKSVRSGAPGKRKCLLKAPCLRKENVCEKACQGKQRAREKKRKGLLRAVWCAAEREMSIKSEMSVKASVNNVKRKSNVCEQKRVSKTEVALVKKEKVCFRANWNKSKRESGQREQGRNKNR